MVCIPNDVWASATDGTFNFNGGKWTHPLLSGSTAQLPAVNGLWGTTSTFVVGVGAAGLILRYDGTGWQRDMAARPDGTGTLYGVAGSGANDIWAVGDNHLGAALSRRPRREEFRSLDELELRPVRRQRVGDGTIGMA